jgi:hypothetical protein
MAIAIAIRLFLPSDWAKIPLLILGVGVLMAIGWIRGRTTMHKEMQAKLDAERARKRQAPKPPEDQQPWKWPWEAS